MTTIEKLKLELASSNIAGKNWKEAAERNHVYMLDESSKVALLSKILDSVKHDGAIQPITGILRCSPNCPACAYTKLYQEWTKAPSKT
jgi:hypothetical protein